MAAAIGPKMTEHGQDDVSTSGEDAIDVVVDIGEEVDTDHTEAIKASVATLAQRSALASRRARQSSQAQADLLAALTSPLGKQTEASPEVTEAAAAAQRVLDEQQSAYFNADPGWPPETKLIMPASGTPDVADRVFTLPFPAHWEWHHGKAPYTSNVDRTTGHLELAATANGGEFTEAHAGFGVTLTTDTLRGVIGRALRRTMHRYTAATRSWGSVATVEGGTELTVLENGSLLTHAVARDRRFRKRVSNGESDGIIEWDGWETGPPVEVVWVMRPGRVYTFNVDGWIYCKGEGGFLGASTAWAQLRGHISTLTAFFD